MKDRKTQWFLPYRYVVPADLEAYLEQMEARGWHVEHISQISSFCMRFRRVEPKKVRYAVELNAFPKSDYAAAYESFGWELAGKMASLYVWRIPYEGKRPEAFSDKQSLHKRSNQIAAVMLAMILFLSAGFVAVTSVFFALRGWETLDGVLGYSIQGVCVFALLALCLWVRLQVRKNRDR